MYPMMFPSVILERHSIHLEEGWVLWGTQTFDMDRRHVKTRNSMINCAKAKDMLLIRMNLNCEAFPNVGYGWFLACTEIVPWVPLGVGSPHEIVLGSLVKRYCAFTLGWRLAHVGATSMCYAIVAARGKPRRLYIYRERKKKWLSVLTQASITVLWLTHDGFLNLVSLFEHLLSIWTLFL